MAAKGFSSYRCTKEGLMVADGEGQWVQRSAAESMVKQIRELKAEAHTLTRERDYALKLGQELSDEVTYLRNELAS